jgi:putative ABC transport system ATP-binding protein
VYTLFTPPKEFSMTPLQTQSLTKIYGSGATAVTALDHINMTIKPGEFAAIMGPSGCGKSTLLHLLGGLDKPTGGKVFLEGAPIDEMSDDKLTELRRRKMGFVFQFFNLIPVLTAVENAALPITLDGVKPTEAKAKATEWLTRFGLADRLNNRPDQLSGGQQQRVAVARALVAEPTGNLDTRAGDEIASLLRKVAKEFGRTVVMVTHDARIAAYADRIIFLKDGKMIDETWFEGKNGNNAGMVEEKMKEIAD